MTCRTCATAITGILNMFILAHVFGGADIDRERRWSRSATTSMGSPSADALRMRFCRTSAVR